MTLAELDEHIKTFKRRVNDPNLSEAQRAAFQAALEGAEKQRQELLAAQAPTVLPKPERTVLKPPVDTQSGSLPETPPVAIEPDTAAVTLPEPPAPTGGPEKKTMVRSSVPTVGTVSTQKPDANSIVVECDLEGFSKTVIVFRWGKTEERLSPGVAMGRFKARVADVARLKNRRLKESRCFRRAVGYYEGLCRFAGRKLTATDLGFRGKKAEVLEVVREGMSTH